MSYNRSKTELLKVIKGEINKEYVEFDAQGRVQKKYVAPSWATDNDPCFVVEYIYAGASLNVKGRKEGYAVWSSIFDNNPALLVDDVGDQLQDNLANDLLGA